MLRRQGDLRHRGNRSPHRGYATGQARLAPKIDRAATRRAGGGRPRSSQTQRLSRPLRPDLRQKRPGLSRQRHAGYGRHAPDSFRNRQPPGRRACGTRPGRPPRASGSGGDGSCGGLRSWRLRHDRGLARRRARRLARVGSVPGRRAGSAASSAVAAGTSLFLQGSHRGAGRGSSGDVAARVGR